MTGVLCMWCLSYRRLSLSYFGTFVHVWFGMFLSKIQSHDGTGGQRGTTMKTATIPELFTNCLGGGGGGRERAVIGNSRLGLEGYLRNKKGFFASRILEGSQPTASLRSSSRMCMHAGLEGTLDPPVQHAPDRSHTEVPVTVTVPLLSYCDR